MSTDLNWIGSSGFASICSTIPPSWSISVVFPPLGGAPGRPDLEHEPELEHGLLGEMPERDQETQDVHEGVAGLLSKPHAVLGSTTDVDEPERLEHPEGLADGRARDAEPGGQLALGRQLVADGQLTGQDRLLELIEDLLERPPRLDWSQREGSRDQWGIGLTIDYYVGLTYHSDRSRRYRPRRTGERP